MTLDTSKKYSWMELHKDHFDHNVHTFYNKLLPHTKISMVLKSNAYGHGLLEIGSLCEQNPHIHTVCTINEKEALQLRQAGIKKPILIIGYVQDYKTAILAGCQITIYDMATLQEIISICQAYKLIAYIHIKIDTGLSRLGFLPETIKNVMLYIYTLPFLKVVGVMSHFAEPYNQEYSSYQLDQFHKSLTLGNFDSKVIRHICNSGGAFLYPHAHLDMVRIGIGLYGYLPSSEDQTLLPIGKLKAPLIHIKTIPENTFVGYELLTKTTRKTTIGIISFGYHEGIDRNSGKHNYVCMNGHKAPLIGRVSMNLCAIDLTDIPEMDIHNYVTILGCKITEEKMLLSGNYPSIYEQLVRIDPEIEKTFYRI